MYIVTDVVAQCGYLDACGCSYLLVYAVDCCRVVALDEELVGGECVYQLFVVVKTNADPDACAAELVPLLYAATISV